MGSPPVLHALMITGVRKRQTVSLTRSAERAPESRTVPKRKEIPVGQTEIILMASQSKKPARSR